MSRPSYLEVEHVEDINLPAIKKALKDLEAAGIPDHQVSSYTYNLLTLSGCDTCQRVWGIYRARSLPGWEEHSRGRGRHLELGEVRPVLEKAGWKDGPDYCETCLLAMAAPFGVEAAKMPAAAMKRFVRTFAMKIDACFSMRGEKFRDSVDYKFYVLFTKSFFEHIPAKNRKSFGLLTQIMHKLELL